MRDDLHKSVEAQATACSTAKEAFDLYNACGHGWEEKIFFARGLELADPDAYAKAKACTTLAQARSLYSAAKKGSHAQMIYEDRMRELTAP